MEIEYAYSFYENIFYTGVGMLRFYLWLIPFAFVYSFYKHRASLMKLFGAVFTVSALFYWEYDSLGEKFGTIAYEESGVTLFQKSGQQVSLNPKQIERFWSISIGRSGGWSCYLLVKAEGRDYESFIVRKRDHLCEDDAILLNEFYGKG